MVKINKLLVANRGEIAVRIIRTAREMGIQTVAVYSEAERNGLHVRCADEAVCIGPAASSRSYLLGERIIAAAIDLGVDAIHPGYGFLSENASFARQVQDAGLIFIGPSPESIKIMGNKVAARRAVSKYQIPMVPGTEDAISDIDVAKEQAREIGYPVLIKASAGGGGKGMRIVEHEADFEAQMGRAISEAKAAFGDGSVFIEKYLSSPRHIEVQILGDMHGNMVHLFERECSIQRRHQKVIEEAPSSVIDEAKRKALGEAAIDVARACHYHNAGTVEFILDENLDFFFLEMNTRLQVEHPVTEMITGIDLVREQILIAEGNKLTLSQEMLKIRGHAIEVRVYAEDPQNNFLPDIGKLNTYKKPEGPGIRVDDGFEEGMEIPIFYDPMIAKLIAHDESRKDAISKMIRAIDEYQINGIKTTLPFARYVMQHPAFQSKRFDTKFIEKHFSPDQLEAAFTDDENKLLAAMSVFLYEKSRASGVTPPPGHIASKWKNRLK